MRQRRRLTDLIDEKIVPIGMQCFTGNHTLIEVLGATGFDYVWLDSEHSALDPRALEDTMRTCEVAGLIPLVRIPEPGDGTSARRAMEAGAEGVVVPMVRSAADVLGIIGELTFPPGGTRGLCPALRVSHPEPHAGGLRQGARGRDLDAVHRAGRPRLPPALRDHRRRGERRGRREPDVPATAGTAERLPLVLLTRLLLTCR